MGIGDLFLHQQYNMSTFKEFLVETSEMEQLRKNKKPLTDEECDIVKKSKATWIWRGKVTKAVWKSVDKNGKTTYVTNSHRAYNTATTLQGAIDRFHEFIKGTA